MVIHSKLRSWLTILGIVIGVAAVIAIMSLGDGMESSLNSQLGDLGTDLITLTAGYTKSSSMMPGGPGRGTNRNSGDDTASSDDDEELTKRDFLLLNSMSEFSVVSYSISGNANIEFNSESGSVPVQGVDTDTWSEITTIDLESGRFLDSADSNVILIGSKLAESYFDKEVGVNMLLTIENKLFRVVGITNENSNSIYMPISEAYTILEDKELDVYDKITLKVAKEDLIDETMNLTENKLRLLRHVTEKTQDFTLSSSQAMQETRAEMMSSMNAFLLAIAAVSLIVGAVGIANTMFTSVLEKTKEIGIMKAIGAKNKAILSIFLLHAGLIGLVGGLLGVFFGSILSSLMPILMGNLRMFSNGALVSTQSIVISLSVSILVGLLAGFVPAYQASKLKPVDALRYD